MVNAVLCNSGFQSASFGACGGAQWRAGCPGGAGSFSVLLTTEMLKSSLEYVAKSSFLLLHENLMKMGNQVHLLRDTV